MADFYDATKPANRDESWRRWKGGTKLADELRAFYTSKTALDRIAANNSFSPGAAKPNGKFDFRSHMLRAAKMRDRRHGGNRQQQRVRAWLAKVPAAEPAMPGKTAPRR